MVIVKKIGVLSFAKIYALLLALVGLLEGILVAASLAMSPQDLAMQNPIIYSLGYYSILVLPLAYAVFGFLIGLLVSWLYNIFAGWLGGVEVELEGEVPARRLKK